MLSKATSTYTAAQVDRAAAGMDFAPSYRVRAESVNKYLEKIRDINHASLVLEGSRVYHNSTTDVRRAAELNIREALISLSAFDTLMISYSPLGYWKLGETSGNFNDSSGNSRTLTANATITYQQASLLAGFTSNTAIKPNGSTGYASIASASWMNVTRITVCGWWKGTGTAQTLIDRDDGSGNRFFRLEVDSSGYVAFGINFTSGSPAYKTFTASIAPVNDGNAHFIVAWYDGAYVGIEVDGVILSRTAETRTMNTTGTCALRLCANNAGARFSSGTHDEWAIFGRALTPEERRNLYQTGTGDLSEIDYTIDSIKVYMGLAMVADPDIGTDSHWAEYPLIVGVPDYPDRQADEFSIIRKVVCQDRSVILKRAKFTTRWTIGASTNYISGTNGVLSIAQAAGLDTSGWSVTTTSLTLPAAIEFKIGDSYLDAINYLLKAIGYKPIRFRGDGQAVIEPIVLPQNRTVEDTLSTNSTSVISPEIIYSADLSAAYNQVTYYTGNPDASFLTATYTNTNWNSPVCVQRVGYNPAPPVQLDAGDQNSLNTGAQNQLAQLAQIPARYKVKTLARPFEDDEDCVQLNLTGTDPTINFSGVTIEEEWSLPLDVGISSDAMMDHTFRQAVSIS